jgi:rubrerythrin
MQKESAMNKRFFFMFLLISALACLIISSSGMTAAGTTMAATAAATKTLDNLQAAYNGESNAQARYLAFAEKADKEGYGQVASLFRAAAKSEGVHVRNFAKHIKGLKAEPRADIKKPEVKSTKENLEAAIRGESAESETLYPGFVSQAKADKIKGADLAFLGAQKAEEGHAKFYKEALSNLSSWKNGKKDFLVCEVCGYTSVDFSLKKCPVCNSPRSKMVTVN